MTDNYVIDLEHVSKYYADSKNVIKALDDVSLKVKEGEFIAITGPSGSGKTTLLSIIELLTRATKGVILLQGKNVATFSRGDEEKHRARMGMVFQRFYLFPEQTALENVTIGIAPMINNEKKRNEIGTRVLKELGLEDRLNQNVQTLSGGEQQRVAVARAIAKKPFILLADEPTGNLDTENGRKIMETFFNFNENHNQTILLVTHNEKLASDIGNKISILDGKIVSDSRE